MRQTVANEPVMSAILAVVAATIALLVAFHVHVTADQREAIEGWVGAVLLLGVVVRSRVTPQQRQQQGQSIPQPGQDQSSSATPS